jgi:hypothetical protein
MAFKRTGIASHAKRYWEGEVVILNFGYVIDDRQDRGVYRECTDKTKFGSSRTAQGLLISKISPALVSILLLPGFHVSASPDNVSQNYNADAMV